MSKFKKLNSLILCVALILSVIAGCGHPEQSGDIELATRDELKPEKIGDYSTLKLPIDTKGTTIEILCNTDVTTNNDSVVIKELRRRTGLNVQIPEEIYERLEKELSEEKI